MLDYQNDLVLRAMQYDDQQMLENGFAAQGWHKDPQVFQKYLQEQATGDRQVIVAVYKGNVAGYLTVVPTARYGPFAGKGIPELVDFNVFQKYQRLGIGSSILDAAEISAAQMGDTVSLGVGLHQGYGAAQRLYVKRGYVFDGSGVWYHNQPAEPYARCVNDDDLVLYLSKFIGEM